MLKDILNKYPINTFSETTQKEIEELFKYKIKQILEQARDKMEYHKDELIITNLINTL